MGPIFLTHKTIFDFNNFFKTWAFFNLTNKVLKISFSKKQSENFIAGTHAICSLFFSSQNDIKRLRWFSSAYFIHDLLQLIFSEKINIMKIAYIYHHISTIYILSCDSREVPIQDILFWGELSNLPSYPLYYYLHQKNNINKIRLFHLLQKIIFIGIRAPILTYKIIKYLQSTGITKHLFAILPGYLMGIIWSSKIITQNMLCIADE